MQHALELFLQLNHEIGDVGSVSGDWILLARIMLHAASRTAKHHFKDMNFLDFSGSHHFSLLRSFRWFACIRMTQAGFHTDFTFPHGLPYLGGTLGQG